MSPLIANNAGGTGAEIAAGDLFTASRAAGRPAYLSMIASAGCDRLYVQVTYADGTVWRQDAPPLGEFAVIYWPRDARHARRLNGSVRETPARSAMHAAYRGRKR